MSTSGPGSKSNETGVHVKGFRDGDRNAVDRLCDSLREPVRREIARMLGDAAADLDDVFQESLMAALGYLRRDGEFRGDFARLAITIARNRCRDILRHRARFPAVEITPMAEWIADESASPLDVLEKDERRLWLRRAFATVGEACRRLLQSMYVDEESTESIRRRLGLGTVQAVYYRRSMCIERMRKFLNSRLVVRSQVGVPGNGAGFTTEETDR